MHHFADRFLQTIVTKPSGQFKLGKIEDIKQEVAVNRLALLLHTEETKCLDDDRQNICHTVSISGVRDSVCLSVTAMLPSKQSVLCPKC